MEPFSVSNLCCETHGFDSRSDGKAQNVHGKTYRIQYVF